MRLEQRGDPACALCDPACTVLLQAMKAREACRHARNRRGSLQQGHSWVGRIALAQLLLGSSFDLRIGRCTVPVYTCRASISPAALAVQAFEVLHVLGI